jgi:hypothetical protein
VNSGRLSTVEVIDVLFSSLICNIDRGLGIAVLTTPESYCSCVRHRGMAYRTMQLNGMYSTSPRYSCIKNSPLLTPLCNVVVDTLERVTKEARLRVLGSHGKAPSAVLPIFKGQHPQRHMLPKQPIHKRLESHFPYVA